MVKKYKRGKFRRFRKKFFKKRNDKQRLNNLTIATSRYNPIPQIYRTVLRIFASGAIPTGSASEQTYLFNLNNAATPFDTGANTILGLRLPSGIPVGDYCPASLSQFLGFTNDANAQSLYETCRVLASRIKVSWNTNHQDDTGQIAVAPIFDTQYGSMPTIGSGPYSKRRHVMLQQVAHLRNFVKVRRLMGINKADMYGNTALRHTIINGPTEACFWQLRYERGTNAVTTAPMNYGIEIDYYLQFEQPIGGQLAETDQFTTTP